MVNKKITHITLSGDPKICTRSIFFDDEQSEVKSKNKKQFVTLEPSVLKIEFDDGCELNINAERGTVFDGATIPFNLGKGNMKFLIPALFHDIICENKSLVDYDRELADKIFRECLVRCKVNRFLADFMYMQVELYQKIFCNWRKPNG